MPVQIGVHIPQPEQPTADIVPDVKTDDGKGLTFAPTFATADLLQVPADFANMTQAQIDAFLATYPPEKLKEFMEKYRFEGMKLRHDIPDRTIPLTKETLDIP